MNTEKDKLIIIESLKKKQPIMRFIIKQYETLIKEKTNQGLNYNTILGIIENDLGIKNLIPYHTFYRAIKRNINVPVTEKIQNGKNDENSIDELNLNIKDIANSKNNMFE